MTAEDVEAAVAAVTRRHPALRAWVQVAADSLTAGDGHEHVSQASLQKFLWYELPRTAPDEAWQPVALAAASLLEALGLARYAAIARSEATAEILRAWGVDGGGGFARYRAAAEASGVKPPDTALIEWGSIMGWEEVSAYAHVEGLLEDAIIGGELRPGATGWKARAAAVCDRGLGATAPGGPRQTWLSRVIDERVRTWVSVAHPESLRAWRAAAAERVAVPPDPPGELDAVVGPMRWMLETCAAGLTTTQSGYLPPAVVHDAVDRFGWWEWPARPRSESEVHQLIALRETASRLRLLTKHGRRLTTSRSGARLFDDPAALWRHIATRIGDTDAYGAMMSELAAHRLLAGPAEGDAVVDAILPIVAAQGWRSGGKPADARDVSWAVHSVLNDWRLFGLLDEVRPRWENGRRTGPDITSLTGAGRATALAWLHRRATGPRHDLRP